MTSAAPPVTRAVASAPPITRAGATMASAAPVARAASAMGLPKTDSLTGVKEHLLSRERAATLADLRPAEQIREIKFFRSVALADLVYLALPGLTSRVATRTRLPKVPSSRTYLSLVSIPASRTGESVPELEAEELVVEELAGLTSALFRSVSVALLSAVQYGYNCGNMNTQAGVQRVALGIPVGIPDNDNIWALCVSLFCVGALLGCNLSGSLADRWGRKHFMLVASCVFGLGGLLEAACVLPPQPESGPAHMRIATLIAGRLVTGVACGGTTVVLPMYLGEVSPAHLRGMLGTAFQLCSVVSMFVAQLAGLPFALGTERLWPLVLALVALPSVLQLALAGLLIESPRWYCAKGEMEQAEAALSFLRDVPPTDEGVVDELDLMTACADQANASRGGRSTSMLGEFGALLRPPTRFPLLIAVTLMGVQQLSGVNNVFNFSSVFLKANHLDDATIQLIAIFMNLGNVAVTVLSVLLMDRAGRRSLLLLSTAGMLISLASLTVALKSPGESYTTALSVCSVVLFVASFGFGLGPVAWLLPAEIMPAETRLLGSSVAASTNWVCNLIASQLFLVIANALDGYAFVPFGVCIALGGVFISRFVPETKGKSLEQIQMELLHSS